MSDEGAQELTTGRRGPPGALGRRGFLAGAGALLLGAGVTAGGLSVNAGKKSFPDRPIWLINPSTTGGSTDVLYRAINEVAQREKIFKEPFVIVNDGSGMGSSSQARAAQAAPDGYTLTVANNNTIFQDLSGEAAIRYDQYTYVARLAADFNSLVVTGDSRFRSFKELLEAARAAPGKIRIAGSRTGSVDHGDLLRLNRASGLKFDYVGLLSGTAALNSMLAGQADAVVTNPVDVLEDTKTGKYRILVSGSPNRLPALPDVPTLKEAGYDLILEKFRGLAGPKGMPGDVIAVLETRLKQLTETRPWKEFLDKYQQVDGYMDSATFTRYMQEQYRVNETMFREIGLLKPRV